MTAEPDMVDEQELGEEMTRQPQLEALVAEHLEEDVAELMQTRPVQEMGDWIAHHGAVGDYLDEHGLPTLEMRLRCSRSYHERYQMPVHGRGAFGAIAHAVVRRARQTTRALERQQCRQEELEL